MARLGEANISEEAIHERRMKAMELRIAGRSYPAIAKELGVSVTQAYNDVHHRIKKIVAEEQELGQEALALELKRLDLMVERLAPYIDREIPSIDHMEIYLKVMTRRAKLLGLDAATKHEVEVKDKRRPSISDADMYKKIREMHERIFKSTGIRHPILDEKSPFELPEHSDVIEGELLGAPESEKVTPEPSK